MDRTDKLIAVVLGLLFTLLVLALAWSALHPCTRFETRECEECVLEMMLPDAEGQPTIPVCVDWEKKPCQVCVERAP